MLGGPAPWSPSRVPHCRGGRSRARADHRRFPTGSTKRGASAPGRCAGGSSRAGSTRTPSPTSSSYAPTARPSGRSCTRGAGPAGRWSIATSATGPSGRSAPPRIWGSSAFSYLVRRLTFAGVVGHLETERGKVPDASRWTAHVHGPRGRGSAF